MSYAPKKQTSIHSRSRCLRLATYERLKCSRLSRYDKCRTPGHIFSVGSFGYWIPSVGHNSVVGPLHIRKCYLHDIGDIGGTLSSEGSFRGNLAGFEPTSTFTPDFSVDRRQATPVTVSAHFAINALSGNVLLDAINANIDSTAVQFPGASTALPWLSMWTSTSTPVARRMFCVRFFIPILRLPAPSGCEAMPTSIPLATACRFSTVFTLTVILIAR